MLNPILTDQLAQRIRFLHQSNQMTAARIGNHDNYDPAQKVRSDKIYWLDKNNQNDAENAFLQQMDVLMLYLNNSCYAGITGYEFHYTYYEVGMFYSKHLDQFKSNSDRKFSFVLYLNEDWLGSDGGALRAYIRNETIDVLPSMGSAVFFKSDELLHEVLPTNRPRLSITGWFKNNPL